MKTDIFFGPPGTGKTTKLLDVVKGLFDEGFDPREIAFVSFTKKASAEARDRAIEKFPHLPKKDFEFWSTIHSICFKRLKITRTDVMSRDNWQEIAEQTNCPMLGYYNLDDGNLAGGTEEGDRMLFHYGLAHARMVSAAEHYDSLPSHDRWSIKSNKFKYWIDTVERYKQATGLLDFNDMLEHAVLTGPVPGIRVAVIDEAQDLSLRQWEVVRSLFGDCERIFIAGDDDQSIFEWSGADINTFLNLKGTKLVLDKSYRLPRRIFDFANGLTERIAKRIDKDWRPDDREGSVQMITQDQFTELRSRVTENDGQSWMLLARNRFVLNEYIDEIQGWGIPYAIKGKSSVKHDDLRAIRAYEQLRSGKPAPVGEAQMAYNYLHGGRDIARGNKTLPDHIPEEVTWDLLHENHGLDPKNVLREKAWFDVFSEARVPLKQRSHYRAIRRHGYSTTGKPKINCSTVHGVKGGEADNVIVIDRMASRTYREMDENPDAEHRVQYVAATRAKENLFVLTTMEKQSYPF